MPNLQTEPLPWSTLRARLARYLPPDLFNSLQELPENLEETEAGRPVVRQLQTAKQALESLERVLLNYTPRYLLELEPAPGQPHGELVEGSFVFADVTGFTALTELLARQGQARGREAMNQIMNDFFASVLDPLALSGGDLLIFAGDAVLAYFPRQEENRDVFQAVRAALRMQRAIRPFADFETEFGRCSLTMSAGVERGLAYAGVVGTKQRMELLFSGPAIDQATQAEELSQPGQVSLGRQALTIAQSHFTLNEAVVVDNLGTALDEFEILLPTRKQGRSVFFSLEVADILQVVESTLRRVERLAPFLPEDILARLVNSKRQQLQPEFRPVAIQFINIRGLEELAINQGPELATTVWQRYFVRAQEIVNWHEGVITQVDPYGQTFTLLNTYGAPRAHEGTKRYAVSAALELSRTLAQINRDFRLNPPLTQRAGITYGLAFTGEIGAKYRREAVTAGPAVNRAARLMSKAEPGQVILDADVWQDTQAAFVGEPLPPVNLKGIDGPVVIANVSAMRLGTRLQPPERPLLGREEEQARLGQAVENLLAAPDAGGNGWLVSGETGMGKTALVADLAYRARQQKMTVLVGRAQPHGRHIPLFPWKDLLIGWLDADGQIEPARQRVRLKEELACLDLPNIEQGLADLLELPPDESHRQAAPPSPSQPRGSLLSALSKVQQDSPAPGRLAGGLNSLLNSRLNEARENKQTMWQRLRDRVSGPAVVRKLLTRLAQRRPVLIITEDIHWADPDSLTLLQDLLADLLHLPLMIVATRNEPLAGQNKLRLMHLDPLPEPALVQVAQRTLGAQALEEDLARWISRRAGGNPLYGEALCQELRRSEAVLLDKGTGTARQIGPEPRLPLSLHELLLARLDRLPLIQQEVLKRGAILGMSFACEAILWLYRNQGPAEIRGALDGAVQASFLTVDSEGVYRFKHPLTQEAIYSTLSFSQRQKWHAQVANWLDQNQVEPDQHLEQIADHYLRSDQAGQAAEFGCRAAHKAKQQGIYAGALDYYQRVLARPDAPAGDRLVAAEGQADILVLQKKYREAAGAYSQAAELGSPTAPIKRAILDGDGAALTETDPPLPLRPWVEGARAWLLAQEGRTEAALQIARPALARAEGAVEQAALQELVTRLSGEAPLAGYPAWLERFGVGALLEPEAG